MIFTTPMVARLVAILLGGCLLQIAALSQVVVFGTQVDIVPALVVCLAILAGSVPGAVIGFGTGLFVDVSLLQPMGLSSLILLGVGYLAGRYRELYDISSALTPLLLAGGLTVAATAGFGILQLLLGVEAPVSPLIVRDVFVKGLVNVFVAIPMYVAIRRLVRPALIDDVVPRRRSGPAIGWR
jgi:rod shape-determining protein MreD